MTERLSNALKALGTGLTTIAAYRGMREEKEGEQAFQKEMRDGQNAFQTRLLELQQANNEKMQTKVQEFTTSERKETQLFSMELHNKQEASAERRFLKQIEVQYAGIRAQLAASGGGAADRKLTRQLGAYEMQIKLAADEYTGIQKSMNEEMKALADDKMLSLRPEQMKAARAEITLRYQPQFHEAKSKITEGLAMYSGAVGIPNDHSKGVITGSSTALEGAAQSGSRAMSGGMAATAAAFDDDKVLLAVQAAQAQLGSSLPPEKDLVTGFMAAGLSQSEAVKAARMLQRQTPKIIRGADLKGVGGGAYR